MCCLWAIMTRNGKQTCMVISQRSAHVPRGFFLEEEWSHAFLIIFLQQFHWRCTVPTEGRSCIQTQYKCKNCQSQNHLILNEWKQFITIGNQNNHRYNFIVMTRKFVCKCTFYALTKTVASSTHKLCKVHRARTWFAKNEAHCFRFQRGISHQKVEEKAFSLCSPFL